MARWSALYFVCERGRTWPTWCHRRTAQSVVGREAVTLLWDFNSVPPIATAS
jgi:hypothetical protein